MASVKHVIVDKNGRKRDKKGRFLKATGRVTYAPVNGRRKATRKARKATPRPKTKKITVISKPKGKIIYKIGRKEYTLQTVLAESRFDRFRNKKFKKHILRYGRFREAYAKKHAWALQGILHPYDCRGLEGQCIRV